MNSFFQYRKGYELFLRRLVNCKLNGYPSKNSTYSKLPDGSKRFWVQVGNVMFTDYYWGSNPFFGVEAAYIDDSHNTVLVWSMSYCGQCYYTHSEQVEFVFSFLKSALKEVSSSTPYRGPLSFARNDGLLFYECKWWKSTGNMLHGMEIIRDYRGNVVYQLTFHAPLL